MRGMTEEEAERTLDSMPPDEARAIRAMARDLKPYVSNVERRYRIACEFAEVLLASREEEADR
jgi:hypothetical protein